MADDVEIRVRAHNDTKKAWSDVRSDVDKLGRDLEKSGNRIGKDLGDGIIRGTKEGTDKLDRELERSGDKAGQSFGKGVTAGAKSGIESVDSVVNKTFSDIRGETEKYTRETASHGDRAGKNLGSGLIGGLKGHLDGLPNMFNRTWSDVGGSFNRIAGNLGKAGLKIGKDLGDGVVGGIKGAADKVPQLITGVAAVAAPLLGSIIGGAVIGGLGIGVAGIGAALATRNAEVRTAGKDLGRSLMAGLTSDSSGFVQPLLKQIDKVGDAFEGQRGRIRSIFSNSTGFLEPLVSGVTGMIEGILRGTDKLTSRAQPVVEAFGRMFNETGDALGDFFDTISQGSDGAASGIDGLSNALGNAIRFTGEFVLMMERIQEASDGLDKYIDKGRYWFEDSSSLSKALHDVGIELDITADGFKKGTPEAEAYRRVTLGTASAADRLLLAQKGTSAAVDAQTTAMAAGVVSQDEYGHAIQTTGSALMTLDERLNTVNNTTRGLFDSETKAAEAFDALKESIASNGRTLDAHTEKGRANRTALSNLASALNSNYQSYVKVNGEGRAANGIASSNYTSFIKAARGLGISEDAAREYARKLGLIPPKKNTDFHANTHDAAARIAALKGGIAGVKGKTVTVRVSVTGTERLDALGHRVGGYRASGGVAGAASGTTAGSNKMTWVGESGPELLRLPPGSHVSSAGDSKRSSSGSGGGDGGTLIVPVYLDGAEIARVTLPHFQKTNRNRYGNSAERMLAG